MRVIVKKITILLQSIRVAKTAKQKGSLYPPVFCSHVRGQTDLPSPFLFFSFSVLFSWIMDETRYLHIFPCSCRMLGHDQIGQGTTQHKVASRTMLGCDNWASHRRKYGAFKEFQTASARVYRVSCLRVLRKIIHLYNRILSNFYLR